MSDALLKRWRSALPYTGGQAKIVLRRMIAELESELHQKEIGTAAQGPASCHEGDGSKQPAADVDVSPGKRAPEKVQTGEMAARPLSSSGSGQIAGAAASAVPPAISSDGMAIAAPTRAQLMGRR